MRNSKHIKRTILATTVLVITAASVTAQLEISRSTVDGGGVMFSTSGGLELCGTIGQPDAGVMTGGNFQLTGGFWIETPPGDCNSDGIVGLLDLKAFADCLGGPADGIDAGCECFDNNRNGAIDLADFSASQRNFAGE